MIQDQHDRLWLATHSGGICCFDGAEWTVYGKADGLPDDRVYSILEDRQGDLWFATQDGLCRCATADGEMHFTLVTQEDGLSANYVMGLFENPKGDLWVSHFDGSLSCGHRTVDRDLHWLPFTPADGLPGDASINETADQRGRHWLASNLGLREYLREATSKGISSGHLKGISTGRLAEATGLPNEPVISIKKSSHSSFWLATYYLGGLFRCSPAGKDGLSFEQFTGLDGLPDDYLLYTVEDRQGRLWISTASHGLSLCKNPYSETPHFSNITIADGLANNQVTSLLEDRQGTIWIGTYGGGLSRLEETHTHSYTAEHDGLADNGVMSLCQDQQGDLWIGTWNGVSRYDGRVFQTLSHKDGLVNNTTQRVIRDRNDDIYWIATEGGLSRYRPQDRPPRVVLKDIIADRHYGAVADLSISVSQDFILFQFQGISWSTGPDGLAYAYRLKGYENQWNYTHDRQVEYRDLGLGDYYFEVCAIDRDLNYSAPLRVDLCVEPDPHVEVLAAVTSALGEEFVGTSASLRLIQNQLAEVAPTEVTVMLFGETGTGKGLAALTLHRLSNRSTGPFIQVNCGAMPHGLVESELFGHEKGAFTGATARRLGKVELAQSGTLFLDEIGDLAADSQVKLLRLLEEQVFERVGGNLTQKADLRIVAATNRDLRQMVANGQFREDLYFRLGTFFVRLPLLRQRRGDIAKLAQHFIEGMAAHLQKPVETLSPEALECLRSFDWPGNVRELQHVIQRAVIVCRGSEIRVGDIALESNVASEPVSTESCSMESVERQHIKTVLEKVNWIVGGKKGAAVLLEMNESTLRSRMRKLGIKHS